MQLSAERINISGGTQARRRLCEATVKEYQEAMEECGYSAAGFPPIKVFYDGKEYWLADGFHRLHAFRKAEGEMIDADVATGTRRDAILFAVGANATHGLKRNNDDKHDAVLTLLDDEEWRDWSDREISKRCNVSASFVAKIRKEMAPDEAQSTERTYTNRHGQEAKMQTAKIGKPDPKPEAPKPEVRQVAVTEEIPDSWRAAQEDDEGDDTGLVEQLEAANAKIAAYEKGSANLRDLVNENARLQDELKREKQSKNFYLDKSGRLTNEIKARDREIADLKAKLNETV